MYLKNIVTPLSIALLCLSFTACSERKNISPMPTISQEAKAELNSPVNCATANQYLKILEEERASVGKKIFAGVRSILPISAVAGILMGDYNDRFEVATGKYNADIDAKIAQIKRVCRK